MKQLLHGRVADIHSNRPIANRVVVASTWSQRLRGLFGTRGLSQDAGLWITPCRSVHTIGLGFSIDVMFIDGTNRVTKVQSNLTPFGICIGLSISRVVLELAAGTISRRAINVGDALAFGSTALEQD